MEPNIESYLCDLCHQEFPTERIRNQHRGTAHPVDYGRSGLLTDEQASAIRELMPFGPPDEGLVRAVAERLGINRQTVFNIAAGFSYARIKACPAGHTLRLALNEKNAVRQRIRSKVKPAVRKEIGDRQHWRCVYCDRDISKRASVDHIVPIDQGGTSDPENLQLTCLRCNQSKGTLSDAEYRVKLTNIQVALARRDERAQVAGWSSYAAEREFYDCPWHHYGCPPGCPGCEMCEHEAGLPDNVICPGGEFAIMRCKDPQCRATCKLAAEVTP